MNFFAFAAGLLLASSAVAQSIQFQTVVLPVFNDGEFITSAVGDLDNDGRNEIVSVNSASHAVRISRVSPSGALTILREINFGPRPGYTAWQYMSVHILDMNADGRKDIVFYHRGNNAQGTLFLLEQSAAGAFLISTYATPESDAAYSMAVADINGDNLPDVVTANHGVTASADLFVLYNSPNPSVRFTQSSRLASGSARVVHVYAADLNRDGRPDVVATPHPFGSHGVVLCYNSPAGLTTPVLLAGPNPSMTAGFGDINSDGQLDIVTTDGGPYSPGGNFQVYRRGAGSYASPQAFPSQEPRSPRVADLNGDGVMDLVIDKAVDHQIAIYFGDPAARDLVSQDPLLIGGPDLDTDHGERSVTDQLVVADVDNNGTPDILFSHWRVVLIRRADNQAPLVSDLTLTPNPAAVGQPVSFSARADDSSTGGNAIASVQYSLDGGAWLSMNPSDGSFDSATETAAAFLGSFGASALHAVCVRASDAAGQTSATVCARLPVYDPSGGFVTGGGRVISPAGAVLAHPNASGPAEFGFVSKYLPRRTEASGEFEFELKAAGFKFKSTAMQWLVMGSEPSALFHGTGVLNGQISCAYEVHAWDNSYSASRVDALGVRIFNCSNGGNAYELPVTPLAGGSIVIH